MRLREFTQTLTIKDWIRLIDQRGRIIYDDWMYKSRFQNMLGGHPIRKKSKEINVDLHIPMWVVEIDTTVFVRGGSEVDVPGAKRGFYYCPDCKKQGKGEELRYIPDEDNYMCPKCLGLFMNKKGEWRRHTLGLNGEVIETKKVEEKVEKITRFYEDENA